MRVMIVQPGPNFSVLDVANGVSEGLRLNGCEVIDFNYGERLTFFGAAHVPQDDGTFRQCFEHHEAKTMASQGIYSECYKMLPDVVLFVSGIYTRPRIYEILRARGHRLILWCTESPYEDRAQLTQAPYADLCIINDPTNLDQFRAVQPNTHYIPHAYDPRIHRRREPDPTKVSDFFFVGTGYPSRVNFFEQVDWTGIDAKLAGNWEWLDPESRVERGLPAESPLTPLLIDEPRLCMDNWEAVNWYSNTLASANIYRREFGDGDVIKPHDAGWAMGPREIEMAALGTFYLTEPRGENREVLPMVPTFDGPGDFGEKLRWWLAHPAERAEVAMKAQAAIADRTFESHVARVLQLLDK